MNVKKPKIENFRYYLFTIDLLTPEKQSSTNVAPFQFEKENESIKVEFNINKSNNYFLRDRYYAYKVVFRDGLINTVYCFEERFINYFVVYYFCEIELEMLIEITDSFDKLKQNKYSILEKYTSNLNYEQVRKFFKYPTPYKSWINNYKSYEDVKKPFLLYVEPKSAKFEFKDSNMQTQSSILTTLQAKLNLFHTLSCDMNDFIVTSFLNYGKYLNHSLVLINKTYTNNDSHFTFNTGAKLLLLNMLKYNYFLEFLNKLERIASYSRSTFLRLDEIKISKLKRSNSILFELQNSFIDNQLNFNRMKYDFPLIRYHSNKVQNELDLLIILLDPNDAKLEKGNSWNFMHDLQDQNSNFLSEIDNTIDGIDSRLLTQADSFRDMILTVSSEVNLKLQHSIRLLTWIVLFITIVGVLVTIVDSESIMNLINNYISP